MRIVTNENKITRGARLGKFGTLGGLGLLLAGLIVSLAAKTTALLWLPFVCLLLGIVISSIGAANMNRWVRQPRADQALEQALKGFDDQYRLYNYVLPAPHVLLSPAGLFVITMMGQDGVIQFEGGKFRRNFSLGRIFRFMADEGLGKPFAEGDAQLQALRKLLDQHGAGEGIEIQNVLVFYNPRAQVSVMDPLRPVVTPKGLKRAIRRQPEAKLPSAQYHQMQELFEGS